jgi:hypothetical protein
MVSEHTNGATDRIDPTGKRKRGQVRAITIIDALRIEIIDGNSVS